MDWKEVMARQWQLLICCNCDRIVQVGEAEVKMCEKAVKVVVVFLSTLATDSFAYDLTFFFQSLYY